MLTMKQSSKTNMISYQDLFSQPALFNVFVLLFCIHGKVVACWCQGANLAMIC